MAPTFKGLTRELIARLAFTSSAQLELVCELEAAITARRVYLEAASKPDVVAPRVRRSMRKLVGEAHPHDPEPLPPPTLTLTTRVALARRLPTRVPRHGYRRMTLIAGNAEGIEGDCDGPAMTTARFGQVSACVRNPRDGAIYFVDEVNHRVRKLHNGVVSTFAGRTKGERDGRFSKPFGVAVDSQHRLIVTDSHNHCIRIVATDGRVTTLAGSAGKQGHWDGPVATATFTYPKGVVVAPDGTIFVGQKPCIRQISTDGVVSTLAGHAHEAGFCDGQGADARFKWVPSLAVSGDGTLIVFDGTLIVGTPAGRRCVRKVNRDGLVTTFEPRLEAVSLGLAARSDGTVYASMDQGICEVSACGVVSVINTWSAASLHLDEDNGILYVGSRGGIFAISVQSAAERRAARLFPLVRLWALAQQGRAELAPHGVGIADPDARTALRLMMRRLPAGVLGLVLRFAIDHPLADDEYEESDDDDDDESDMEDDDSDLSGEEGDY